MKLIRLVVLISSLVFVLSAKERVNVNFSDLKISDFIKLVSKVTNKNILLNNKINGTVNFVSTVPVYDDELINILVSVLESKGYTLIQNGSILEVIRSSEVAKHNTKVYTKGKITSGAMMVTQSISLEDTNIDIVASKIRHLISKTAKLVTIKDSNSLLITDYPANIKTIKKVIKDITQIEKSTISIVPIKNAEAKKLKTKLDSLAKSLFNQKVQSQKTKIVLDENTNSIILVGRDKNIKKLKKLITQLDVESNINKTVQIFELKNSSASSVIKSLNEIIKNQKFTDPSLKPNVSVNEEINSIIVMGDSSVIKGIKLIIDELDKEKYQVYVQARIVEINNNTSQDLGVKYGFAGGDISSSGLYAMSANFGDASLTSLASESVLEYLGSIGESAKSTLALGATIDFLEENGASESISNPSILCVNNKESSIYVGKTISVSSGQTAISGQTTSSYKREDVGLTLKIKPRVSSIDKVTLDVEVILENILDDGANNATKQPVTSKQKVKTQAILRHGESIIIGGLVKNYNRDAKTKLPLLGDIPLLGDTLFSSSTKKDEQDNLVVILTPYIIAKSEKLSQLQKDLGELKNIQKIYNQEIFKKIKKHQNIKTQQNNIPIQGIN
jgi:general secretion pathway protein D